jgi:predicted metal-dependent hydrolase
MNEIDKIKVGNTTLFYSKVMSKRRKFVSILISPRGHIEVRTPESFEDAKVRKILINKYAWITKKVNDVIEPSLVPGIKEYVVGETFLLLGRQYRLKIVKSQKACVEIEGKNLVVHVPKKVHKKYSLAVTIALIHQWYFEQCRLIILESVKKYSKYLGIQPPRVSIKDQMNRWGSCTPKNKLLFNYRLVMASKTQIDYVVAHELCHIKYKFHHKQFWSLLRTILYDYEKRKEELKMEGWQYVL